MSVCRTRCFCLKPTYMFSCNCSIFEYYPDKWFCIKWIANEPKSIMHNAIIKTAWIYLWIKWHLIEFVTPNRFCFRYNINSEVWNALALWSRISILMHKLVFEKLLSQKNIPNAQIVNNVVWRFRLKLCILRAFLLLLQLIMLVLRRWISYGNYKQRKEMPTHSMKCYLEPYY